MEVMSWDMRCNKITRRAHNHYPTKEREAQAKSWVRIKDQTKDRI